MPQPHPCSIGLIAVVTFTTPAFAGAPPLSSCATISNDAERLRCYDRIARDQPEAATTEPARAAAQAPAAVVSGASHLQRQWELNPDLKRGTFELVPYRPLYLLVHGIRSPNNHPSSPTRQLDAGTDLALNPTEAKYQLSFKTKLAQGLAGSDGDLWFGYTQQSFWQIGNQRHSSPFRESDYEPELIYVHPVQFDIAGFAGRYWGLALNHQSNGRDKPLSRSWNRLIAELAAESGPWSVHLRPWVRLFSPSGDRNDNPGIENFIGRGEIIAVHRSGGNVVSFTGRHSLRTGDKSHGSAKIDWAFPLSGSLNGHVQLFSGYGESLIDYNFRQTSLGIGISFGD